MIPMKRPTTAIQAIARLTSRLADASVAGGNAISFSGAVNRRRAMEVIDSELPTVLRELSDGPARPNSALTIAHSSSNDVGLILPSVLACSDCGRRNQR
jgi:hypothetical protein